jgi:hypothetical protein
MTITDDQFGRLLRDSAVPWSVNLSTGGDRLISVAEWLAFAQSKLADDIADAALEAATDAYLFRIGGEKLQEAHVFNWLRRLAGRDELPAGWTYSVPAAFFGDENFGLADQLRTAITARQTPGNA